MYRELISRIWNALSLNGINLGKKNEKQQLPVCIMTWFNVMKQYH